MKGYLTLLLFEMFTIERIKLINRQGSNTLKFNLLRNMR